MKTDVKYGKKHDRALGLWVKLARAAATLGKLSTENIRTFGLTEPQFAALECLGHLGPLKLSELSRKMLVSGGNITCVVDNLEREGLAQRVQSKDDRRATLVRLTLKGDKLFNEIFIRHADFITSAASVLDEREQDLLSGLLKKLGLSLRAQFTERKIEGYR